MDLKFLHKNKIESPPIRKDIPVIESSATFGLTEAEAQERFDGGYDNCDINPPTKTLKEIFLTNIITYFNIVFFIFAGFIIFVRSYYNLTFMGIVFANIFIGIVQEIKSKKTLDKLNLISAPKAKAIRDGHEKTLNTKDLVRDDIVEFSSGSQIFADAVVVSGSCHVNEALITGEADEIQKKEGDNLISGSFVVSGKCRVRLTHVGADSYVSRLTIEAKKDTSSKDGEMMKTLSKLVKWIGLILIPLGLAMVFKEIFILERSLQDGVVSTVGALVGMIPEGLYLLTSLALVASIIRLAQKKTLVHEMACIETLARVDTLCVDKTGTITENKMIVDHIVPLIPDRYIESDVALIMSDYVGTMEADNDTMQALHKHFVSDNSRSAEEVLPFSSMKKFSAVRFNSEESYILGAPDVILGESYSRIESVIENYSAKGCRVLLLSLYDGDIRDFPLTARNLPIALILLSNKVRKNAPKTFKFFAQQGVEIKVISGDNHVTVAEVSRRAGIENAHKCIDARTLDSDEKILEAAAEYTVFGRVTPEQKRKLIKALKSHGRTVAMTGDGVNDVLALKEADCSIAMASGSDVACRASNIVLLNSDFGGMPSVVMEGRRVINNIERSASLFLVKNILSFSLAVITLIFALPYPFTPSQLSLVSTITIGIPSFFLALEPNKDLIKGKFLHNVLYKALPAALTNLVLVIGILLFYLAFEMPLDKMSTISAITVGFVGLLMLFKISIPFTTLHRILFISMCTAFILAIVFLREFFTLAVLNFQSALVLAVFVILAIPVFNYISRLADKVDKKLQITGIRQLVRRKKK